MGFVLCSVWFGVVWSGPLLVRLCLVLSCRVLSYLVRPQLHPPPRHLSSTPPPFCPTGLIAPPPPLPLLSSLRRTHARAPPLLPTRPAPPLYCFFQDSVRMLEPELVLQGKLWDAKKEVRRCLCDDFDTPGAVVALQEVVKAVNKVGRERLLCQGHGYLNR